MEPKGVRIACPDCTWSTVVTDPEAMPVGVVKKVYDSYVCPNCPGDVPMKPVASVDTTPRPKSGITAAMTVEQCAAKCVEIQHEAAALAKDLTAAAEKHKDAKKAYEAKLVQLNLAVERLGRVMGGEEIDATRPLLDLAEQEEGRCPSVTEVDGAAVQCAGVAGHGGPHGHGDHSWETPFEAAAGDGMERLRQRLAALHIVVDIEAIEAWSSEDFLRVVAYVEALETNRADSVERPAFLPDDVPEHVTSLHRALAQVGVVVGIADICGWTPQERAEAQAWVAKEAEAKDSADRPDHVPPPAGEAQRTISKRHRGRKPQVQAPVEVTDAEAPQEGAVAAH